MAVCEHTHAQGLILNRSQRLLLALLCLLWAHAVAADTPASTADMWEASWSGGTPLSDPATVTAPAACAEAKAA
jgi:hypothetical protein